MAGTQQIPVISQILPHLFIGNFPAATSAALLRNYNIKSIISVTWDAEVPEELCQSLGISKIDFHIPDGFFRDDKKRLLLEILPKIRNCEVSGENCLINCWASRSRSVALVTTYLMWKGMDLYEAYKFVLGRHILAATKPHTMYCFVKHTGGKFSLSGGVLVFLTWLRNIIKWKFHSLFQKP